MYCPKCGDENEEGAKFCGNCGNPLTVSRPPMRRQPIEHEPPEEHELARPAAAIEQERPEESEGGPQRTAGLKILSALMAIYGLILTFVGFMDLTFVQGPFLALLSEGISLILGLVTLATAWGLLKLQKWARMAPFIPMVMVFLEGLLSLALGWGATLWEIVMWPASIILGVGAFLYLGTIRRLFDQDQASSTGSGPRVVSLSLSAGPQRW